MAEIYMHIVWHALPTDSVETTICNMGALPHF